MKLEEFEAKIVESIKHDSYSCNAIADFVSKSAREIYEKTFKPNDEDCWLRVHFGYEESYLTIQEMRLTMILLFEQYCISEQLYKEF